MWWGRYAYRSRSPRAVTPLNTRAVSTPASMPDKMSVEMLSPMITVSSGLLPARMRGRCTARRNIRGTRGAGRQGVRKTRWGAKHMRDAKHGSLREAKGAQRSATCTFHMEEGMEVPARFSKALDAVGNKGAPSFIMACRMMRGLGLPTKYALRPVDSSMGAVRLPVAGAMPCSVGPATGIPRHHTALRGREPVGSLHGWTGVCALVSTTMHMHGRALLCTITGCE
jgi:hypothetical protein